VRASVERFATSEHRARWLWAIIVVALAARIGWSAWIAHASPAAVTSLDTGDYLGPARALVAAGRFSLSAHDPTPMFLRTPGYPAVLAAILWVTNSQWAISPIQAALSILTVVVTVLVGRRMIGPTAGLVAGVVVALDPLQFALSGTILTESLTSLVMIGMVAVGAAVFARRPERVHPLFVVALGALIALATMFRPTTWFYPVVVLVLLAVRFRCRRPRALLVLLLAFALPIVAVVGAWQVRNHYAVNSWQVSGSAGVTLYCYNAAGVQAKVMGRGIDFARKELGCARGGWDDLKTECPPFWNCNVAHPLANGPGFDEMSSKGLNILEHHPVETAEVVLEGAAREIGGPGTDTVRRFLHVRSSVALIVVLSAWNVLVLALAVVGAVVGLRSRLRMFWLFVISLVAYVVVISAGVEAGARFRTPIVPLLALLAAQGVRFVIASARDRQRQPA
jgi:4-amino-4-deoxy-L-arabinose transferase-like glycosyltransferase